MQRLWGKSPSSMPHRNTNMNSRPFAMCRVIICTLSAPASDPLSPDSRAAWARKASSGGSSTSVLSAPKRAGGAHQLRQVLEPGLAARHLAARRILARLLPAVMLDEPALLEHVIDLLVQRETRGLPRQPVDELVEAAQRVRGPGALLRLAARDGRFHSEMPAARASSRRLSTVRSPMPRVGRFTTRSYAASSSRFNSSRR